MRTSNFDYDLPEALIAQRPVEPRDSSRLLVLDRAKGSLAHRTFREIGEYLRAGDLVVANQSRVLPARLYARKRSTGGKVELLLLRKRDAHTWEALVKGRRTPVGTGLVLTPPPTGGDTRSDVLPPIYGQVVEWTESGGRLIRWAQPIDSALEQLGVVPLPPYIHTPLPDVERYQTVYSQVPGSVAAPTAGLHFTPELLLALRDKGVQMAFVTLDIGLDTFRPVHSEHVEDHQIHTEVCSLSAETARLINQAKLENRRVVAIGTTSVRVLETAARQEGATASEPSSCPWQTVRAFSGETALFIYPGFQFRVVDALITNFHLPRSSLLMLVSAFAGRQTILEAYETAVRENYRFFSFGDAMLIL